MPKVIIEVEVHEIQEYPDEDPYIETGFVTVRGEDVTDSQMYGLAELWAQSDWFYIDFTAGIINAMTKE